MLEHCRRPQLRLEPIAAIPTTRTTTRRTRRLCLNIETNGAGPLRSRRRRRSALPDPYFMTYPPVYGANPWVCGNWGSNEHLYSYGNYYNPFNRLYAGEEYEYAPANGFIPTEQESPQEFYTENSDQKADGDLQNVLMSLNGYLQEENNMEPENNIGLDSIGVPEDQGSQNQQVATLIDVICDTIGRLNNYVTAKNPGQIDIHNVRPLPRAPPPVQVVQMPVQPLLLPPIISNQAIYPPNNPYVMEPESCPPKRKTFLDRIPWLKERKRKRHAKARSQNQSCSTEDLNTLPRILEASNSPHRRVPMNFYSPSMNSYSPPMNSCSPSGNSYSPPMKDSSTTMWCSMNCCESCGLVRNREQEKPLEDAEIPSSVTLRCPMKCCEACGSVRTREQENTFKNAEIPSSMTLRCPMNSSSLVRIQEPEKPFDDFEIPSSMTLRCPMISSTSVRIQEQEKPFEDYKVPSPTPEQERPSEDVKISSSMKRCALVSRTQEQKKTFEEFKYPSAQIPPSLLRAPPPSIKSEDDMDKDHEALLYNLRKTSSYSSNCDFNRPTGGNIIYSYVEEEQEEEHVDEDEWYQGASYKLAELEMEQEFFKEMQKQGQVIMRDQGTQTDGSRSVNIIVTTDKAVSTTDLSELPNQEPVKIVRVYKRSSLKPRHRYSSSSQRLKSKSSHNVKFEREQQTPEVVTIGRCPMDWEETARSINRFCSDR